MAETCVDAVREAVTKMSGVVSTFLGFPITTLVIGVILALLLAFFLPSIELKLRLWRRAREDYRSARGTMHLKLLKESLSVLDKKISEADKASKVLESERAKIAQERQRKLEAALSKYLIDLEFTKIPGIGPVLKDRVVRYCFDGTLKSLRRAQGIRGIGDQRAFAIKMWVDQTERRLPTLLQGYFPGKDGINKAYDELDKQKENELVKVYNDLRSMRELRTKASTELNRLKSVHTSTFVKAYKGDTEAAEKATEYLVGTFPEWGRMPEWFKTLIERHGKASSKG